jgi:ribosomal protein S18 acetylase RimI-like enzyme
MITVRKATSNDSKFIATCLLLAMNEIIYKFIGEEDPEKAKAFLLHFVESDNNQYSYQNCWVAEDDMGVAGAVNLYDGSRLIELRQPVIDYTRSRFTSDYNFEDETHAGEYYIDSLGVNPNYQGQGIGTRLLQFLIDEYVNKRAQTLGLLVDEANPNAKRLYLKLGFTSAGKRILFGKNMEHLQIKG